MTDSTNTTVHNFVPEYWSKKLGPRLHDSGVMAKCVNRNYEGEIKNSGDVVKINFVDGIAVNTYGTGNITYETPKSKQKQLEIDQKKYFAFAVDDIAKVQSNVELTNKYIDEAKKSIELEKDTFLLTKRADVDSNNVIGEITGLSSNIYDFFVSLRTALRNSNAINQSGKAANGKRPWVVINPAIEKLIILSDEFRKRSTSVTDKIIRENAIFEYAGFDVLCATNLKVATTTTGSGEQAVTTKSVEVLAGVDEAITFAGQITKIECIRDKDRFQDLVRGLYVYGAKTVEGKLLAKGTIKLAA